MEKSVEIRMTIDKVEAEKLADLAGGEDHIAEYLTGLIRKLYAEQSAIGDLRLEQLATEAELLVKKHQEYEVTINHLKARPQKDNNTPRRTSGNRSNSRQKYPSSL